MKLTRGKDIDGDPTVSIDIGDMTVFATQQVSGAWTVNFALTAEINGGDWMDTMTGRGAFQTIRAIRPAIEAIIAEIGDKWVVCCDSRRAKLYSRYIPSEKIQIQN